MTYDAVAIARRSLEQAKAYKTDDPAARRRTAENIARLEAFIAEHTDHPSRGRRP